MKTIIKQLKLFYSTKAQSGGGKRITYLDMAKGIAIILVVIGHYGSVLPRTNVWLSSFHMPLFFLVSGLLFAMKGEENRRFADFVGRKAKSLLIPYGAFSLLSILLDFYFKPDGAEMVIPNMKLHLLQTVTFEGYSVLWFLPAMFFSEVVLFLVLRGMVRATTQRATSGKATGVPSAQAADQSSATPCSAKLFTALLLTVLCIAVYYGALLVEGPAALAIFLKIVVKSLIAAAFQSYGLLLWPLFTKHEKWNVWEFVAALGCIAVNIVASGFLPIQDLNNAQVGFLPCYLLLGVVGAMGVLLLCKNCFNIPPLTFWGQNSLIIFATHLNCYVLYYGSIFYQHFEKRGQLPMLFNTRVTCNVFTMLFTFILETFVIWGVNVVCPFLLGKGYPKRAKSEKSC